MTLQRFAIRVSLLISISFATLAQTLVPKPDAAGRPGEIARHAQKAASEKFDLIDEDKDGKLSEEELQKHAPYLAEKLHERDKDADGTLSWEEYIGHNRWPK